VTDVRLDTLVLLAMCFSALVFGGLGWLTFISTPLANGLSPYNMFPGILGEGALTLWLLAVGVHVPRWNQQAGASAA